MSIEKESEDKIAEYRSRKFRRDICRITSCDRDKYYRCSRCDDLDIEVALRAHCDNYIGMKATAVAYDQIRYGIEGFLTKCVHEEDIISFCDTQVVQLDIGLKISTVIVQPAEPHKRYYVSILIS